MRNLVNVSDEKALKANNVPYTRESIYQMKYLGMHPEYFVKIGRYLMFDCDAWNAHIEKIIAERNEKIVKRGKL